MLHEGAGDSFSLCDGNCSLTTATPSESCVRKARPRLRDASDDQESWTTTKRGKCIPNSARSQRAALQPIINKHDRRGPDALDVLSQPRLATSSLFSPCPLYKVPFLSVCAEFNICSTATAATSNGTRQPQTQEPAHKWEASSMNAVLNCALRVRSSLTAKCTNSTQDARTSPNGDCLLPAPYKCRSPESCSPSSFSFPLSSDNTMDTAPISNDDTSALQISRLS